MNLIYNIFIYLIALPAKCLLSLFLPKLKKREKEWKSALDSLKGLPASQKRIWIHASSMGEFEQAKPIIEILKKEYAEFQVICSFYSPSGFETQKKYEYADAILYMPFDLIGNAKYFIESINPDIAVFVRYDAWRNHLLYLKSNNIKSILINATEPKKTFINKSLLMRYYYRNNFSLFDEIFTVSEYHSKYFETLQIKSSIQTTSDTRFDRILEKVESVRDKKIIPNEIFRDKNILVAGSIWETDYEIIKKAVNRYNINHDSKISSILVPHEPNEPFIKLIQKEYSHSILLSELIEKIEKNERISLPSGAVIIVDSIGKLLKLYGNASIAYIGGAFGAGVHSLTEPAGYEIPLLCGEKCSNSPDAQSLINAGALKTIRNADDLYNEFERLTGETNDAERAGKAAGDYIHFGAGSSRKIADYLINSLIC